MSDPKSETSLSEWMIINYHKQKKRLTKTIVVISVVVTALSCIGTYYLTLPYPIQAILGIGLLDVFFTLLSLLATFTLSYRFVLVTSLLAGICLGSLIRIIGL